MKYLAAACLCMVLVVWQFGYSWIAGRVDPPSQPINQEPVVVRASSDSLPGGDRTVAPDDADQSGESRLRQGSLRLLSDDEHQRFLYSLWESQNEVLGKILAAQERMASDGADVVEAQADYWKLLEQYEVYGVVMDEFRRGRYTTADRKSSMRIALESGRPGHRKFVKTSDELAVVVEYKLASYPALAEAGRSRADAVARAAAMQVSRFNALPVEQRRARLEADAAARRRLGDDWRTLSPDDVAKLKLDIIKGEFTKDLKEWRLIAKSS